MSESVRFVLGLVFCILTLGISYYGFTTGKVKGESLENHCTYIGSVGNVAYGYCIDPNTNLEFIGSSNGYMEIVK